MATITDINTWWSTRFVPTVVQRVATFSSFRLKTDKVSMDDVNGLSTALNLKANTSDINTGKVVLTGSASYDVPAGTTISRIWFWGGATDTVIGVGFSDSTNELFDPGACPAGGDLPFDGNKGFRNATTIYFNGVSADTIIIINKQ
jgi:hypothetical protein